MSFALSSVTRGLDTDADPQANPVNRILREMRDRGEVLCHEPEWGEPSFSLWPRAAYLLVGGLLLTWFKYSYHL